MNLIKDCLGYLKALGLLLIAKLLLIAVAMTEIVAMIWVCYWSVTKWDQTGHARWLGFPLLAMVLAFIQFALWHFLWLRYAQRSERHRAIAEYFSISLRHPIVRPPRTWE